MSEGRIVVASDVEVMSVWDLSHRWEGIAPPHRSPKKLSKSVQNRVRQLLLAMSDGLLNSYNASGEDISEREFWYSGVRRKKLAKKVDHHLHQRIYNKEFLQSVFIRLDEVERWSRHTREVLPAFCFPNRYNH